MKCKPMILAVAILWIASPRMISQETTGQTIAPLAASATSKITFTSNRDGGPCCSDGVYNVEIYV